MENEIKIVGSAKQVSYAEDLISKLVVNITENRNKSEEKQESIEKKFGDKEIMDAIKSVNAEDGEVNASNIIMILINQKQEKMLVDNTSETFESRLRS